MGNLKKIWKFLDGKKTNIAHMYWAFLIPSSMVIWPDGVPREAATALSIIGIFFTSIGYGHKSIKKNREN